MRQGLGDCCNILSIFTGLQGAGVVAAVERHAALVQLAAPVKVALAADVRRAFGGGRHVAVRRRGLGLRRHVRVQRRLRGGHRQAYLALP